MLPATPPPLMDLLKFRINVMSRFFLSNYMCCIRDASFTVNTLFISWGGDIERIYHSPVYDRCYFPQLKITESRRELRIWR